jgi:hypothetical protein
METKHMETVIREVFTKDENDARHFALAFIPSRPTYDIFQPLRHGR